MIGVHYKCHNDIITIYTFKRFTTIQLIYLHIVVTTLAKQKKKKIKNKKNKYVPWYQGLEIDIKIWLKFSYCINYILDEKEPMFRMYYLGIIGER